MLIYHMGETIDHSRLLKHYRHMARAYPGNRRFWRMRVHAVAQTVRETVAAQMMARAA